MSSPFPPVGRSETLAQQAYQAIRVAIQTHTLVPGTFYSENELGRSMGISRTPVREALIELAREGLVEIVPQRGFRLRVLTPDEAAEVFELRIVLESHIVRTVAKEATSDQLDQLSSVLDRQGASIDDPEQFLRMDEEFHLLMPELINRWRTHQMMSTLRGAVWLLAGTALSTPSRADKIMQEHHVILEAIKARDPDAAALALEAHMHSTAAAAAVAAAAAEAS